MYVFRYQKYAYNTFFYIMYVLFVGVLNAVVFFLSQKSVPTTFSNKVKPVDLTFIIIIHYKLTATTYITKQDTDMILLRPLTHLCFSSQRGHLAQRISE